MAGGDLQREHYRRFESLVVVVPNLSA